MATSSQIRIRDSHMLYPVPVASLRDHRRGRLSQLLDSHDLAALLAFSTDSVTGRGNVRYIADWPTPIRQSAVLVDKAGHTILLVTHITHAHWAREFGWADETRLVEHLVLDALAAAKAHLGDNSATRIGVVGNDLFGRTTGELQAEAGSLELVDLNVAFAGIRRPLAAIDAPFYELNGEIVDAVMEVVLNGLRAGVRENELYAMSQAVLSARGCEDALILIGSQSKHNLPIPSARVLRDGDVVRFSVEPCGPGGYWAQVARTICIGQPSDEVAEVHDVVMAGLTRGLEVLRPGVAVREAALEIRRSLEKAQSILPEVVIGHGVGLNLAEAPRVTEKSTETLSEGMVLTIHPGAYRKQFGVFIGETVRVTATGAVPITKTPLKLFTVPA